MALFDTLRIIHIAAGSVAFVVAPIALIVKKGGNAHRKWGLVFFWAMAVVGTTAVIMAPMHENLFLMMLGVFSFYLAFKGYRSVFRKHVYKTKKTAFIDWFFAILNTVFSMGLLALGIYELPQAFGIIACVFGSLGAWLGIKDIIVFLKPSDDPKAWFFSHMVGMVTAYIAAVSAFSAVNMGFLPPVLQWLWPTIIGAPLLSRWAKSYRSKFSKGKKVSHLVQVSEENE
jgi:hypothetical protein